MTGIVKFTIVGHQGLDGIGIVLTRGGNQLAILCCEERVILAYPAVVVAFIPVHRDIAEHDDNILRSCDNFLPVMFAVRQKAGLFPGIAQQIAGNGHFGEDDHISLIFFGFINHAQHRGSIFIGMPRNDFHLGHSYF